MEPAGAVPPPDSVVSSPLSDPGMEKDAGSGNPNVLEGSMELLTLGSALLASSLDNEDNHNADDIDYCWGEDEVLNYTADDGSSLSSAALEREWNKRREHFHTLGYQDGIAAGKEASAQEGFNIGFRQSARSGYNWGHVRGIPSAYASLPQHLKDKLAVTQEKRERLHNLHQSAQMISTSDALKIFNKSVKQAETRDGQSENRSHSAVNDVEPSSFSGLDGLFKELTLLLHDSPEINIKIEPAQ